MKEIYITEDISEKTLSMVVSELDGVEGEVLIHLTTYGGSVYDGFALASYLSDFKDRMTIVARGYCMSAGIIVLLSAKPERRFSDSENTRFMTHNAWGGVVGDKKEMQKSATELEWCDESIFSFYQENGAKLSKENFDSEYFFDSKKAIELNIISKII